MANWRKIARHPLRAAQWYLWRKPLFHLWRWWSERPYAPWWLLGWIDNREYYCWASVVSWKVGGETSPSRNVHCITGPTRDGKEPRVGCWCGYWDRVADGSIRLMRENIRQGRPAFEGSDSWPQFASPQAEGRGDAP